ncbi:MAG: aspartate-semialdehyde dehydrogenase, partial [Prochlorococcus sp.]
LLASARSAGQTIKWGGALLTVEEVNEAAFQGVDLVLASAGGSVSRQWRQAIKAAGAVMVDNSSAFRMEADVPLVVPEVNPEALQQHQGVIA